LRGVRVALLTMVYAALACCSSPPQKPEPVNVKLTIAVSSDVNPDAQNRPSPIVIRLYQLRDATAFKDADFFALYDKEEATLAAALVSRVEFELTPGEQRLSDFSLSPDAHFLGIAAAYRDIRNAQWRALAGSAEKGMVDVVKKNKITIAVARARVSFAGD